MSLDSLILFVRLLTPSRIIFFHFSFMFILFYLFFKFIYLFLFSYNCLHFLHFPIPYLFTVCCLHEISLGGNTDTTKTANATNQRFSSSVEPVVKYHHTTTSIPNIFKYSSLLHFLGVVFNLVGVRMRARLFKKRQLCVF